MQYINIFKSAAENKSFLKVLFTHRHLQVAISSIKPGEGSGNELWNANMAVLVLWGQGHAVVGGEERNIATGDFFCVPANTEYTIINLGTEPLKLMLTFSEKLFKEDTNEGSKVSEIIDPYKIRPDNRLL